MGWQEELRQYIVLQMSSGKARSQIEQELLAAGWKAEMIGPVLQEMIPESITPEANPTPPTPTPSIPPYTRPASPASAPVSYTAPFAAYPARPISSPAPAASFPAPLATPATPTISSQMNPTIPTRSMSDMPSSFNSAGSQPASGPDAKPGIPKMYLLAGIVLLVAIVLGAVLLTQGSGQQKPALETLGNATQPSPQDASGQFQKSLDLYLASPFRTAYDMKSQTVSRSTYARSNVTVRMNATFYSKDPDAYRIDLMLGKNMEIRTYLLNGTGYSCTKVTDWICQKYGDSASLGVSLPGQSIKADLAQHPEIKSLAPRTIAGVAASCHSLEIPGTVSSEYCFASDGALLYAHRFSSIGGNMTNLTMEALSAPAPATDADFVLPAAPASATSPNIDSGTIGPTDSGPAAAPAADAKTELANLLALQARSAWTVEYDLNQPQGGINWSHDGKDRWHLSRNIGGENYRSYALNGQYYACDETTGDWICYYYQKAGIVTLGADYGLLAELKRNTVIEVKKAESRKMMMTQTTCFKLRFTTYAGTYCYMPKTGALVYSNTGIEREAGLHVNMASTQDFVLPTGRIINETAGGFGS